MAYSDIAAMAASPSLMQRIAGAATQENVADPIGWAQRTMWRFAAS
jgi:hypothetical protein